MNKDFIISAILEEIENFSQGQLVQLNNTYCDCINDPDSNVFENDEEFFNMLDWSGLRVAQATFYGDYNYSHNWVTFDGYGNLQSYRDFTVDQLVELPKIMAEYIYENYEDFSDLFSSDVDQLIYDLN